MKASLSILCRMPYLGNALAFLLARRVAIRGWSMYPTLAPGERVLFSRWAYRSDSPQAGDIVLAASPSRRNELIVKRVAALPGDYVAIDETGRLVKNQARSEIFRGSAAWILGEDEYFLIGDSPELSTDSRQFGPVNGRNILAKAWLVYWPPSRSPREISGGTAP